MVFVLKPVGKCTVSCEGAQTKRQLCQHRYKTLLRENPWYVQTLDWANDDREARPFCGRVVLDKRFHRAEEDIDDKGDWCIEKPHHEAGNGNRIPVNENENFIETGESRRIFDGLEPSKKKSESTRFQRNWKGSLNFAGDEPYPLTSRMLRDATQLPQGCQN